MFLEFHWFREFFSLFFQFQDFSLLLWFLLLFSWFLFIFEFSASFSSQIMYSKSRTLTAKVSIFYINFICYENGNKKNSRLFFLYIMERKYDLFLSKYVNKTKLNLAHLKLIMTFSILNLVTLRYKVVFWFDIKLWNLWFDWKYFEEIFEHSFWIYVL